MIIRPPAQAHAALLPSESWQGGLFLRCFVALRAADLFAFGPGAPAREPEDPLSRLSVESLESSLKGAGGKLRFVKPDARHLTLRFLGDVEAFRGPEISKALDEAVKGFKPFPVGVRGVGFFPNARRPKVIWVGIDDPEKRIGPLHREVEECLAPLGFEKSAEGFVPHITLARVKEVPPGDALAQAVDPLVNSRFGWSQASGVDFYESDLRPEGPVYRLVSKHLLPGAKEPR